jgi:hypothetical protein
MILASAIALLAPVLMGNGIASRYYLVFLCVPILAAAALAPFGQPWLQRLARPGLLGLLALFGLVLGFFTWAYPPSLGELSASRPKGMDALLALIEKRHLHHGLVGYYDNKPLRSWGQSRIQTACVGTIPSRFCPILPKWWNANLVWSSGRLGEPYPLYDWTLVYDRAQDGSYPDGHLREALLASFGPPAWKVSVMGRELWAYDRPQDLGFRNCLRKYMQGHAQQALMTFPDGKDVTFSPQGLKLRSYSIHLGKGLHLPWKGTEGSQVLEFWTRPQDAWELSFEPPGSKAPRRVRGAADQYLAIDDSSNVTGLVLSPLAQDQALYGVASYSDAR